jgi:hypothetical protein
MEGVKTMAKTAKCETLYGTQVGKGGILKQVIVSYDRKGKSTVKLTGKVYGSVKEATEDIARLNKKCTY